MSKIITKNFKPASGATLNAYSHSAEFQSTICRTGFLLKFCKKRISSWGLLESSPAPVAVDDSDKYIWISHDCFDCACVLHQFCSQLRQYGCWSFYRTSYCWIFTFGYIAWSNPAIWLRQYNKNSANAFSWKMARNVKMTRLFWADFVETSLN